MRTGCRFAVILSLAISWSTASVAVGIFDLQVSTIGFSKSQRDAFAAAEDFWESVIVGYVPGITQTTLPFSARKLGLDGSGGILGQAGPTGSVTEGGFVISTGGSMIIDAADISLLSEDGQLADVIAHEIGHILGIGTLWDVNGLYVNNSGQYTGSFGLQAYQAEFDTGASFVPVELDGGVGTANGHWDELASVFDPEGRPLTEELMTGFLGSESYLSQTTIQSLRDLGFEVIDPPDVPLPGDFDLDGAVDGYDFLLWQRNPSVGPLADWEANYGTVVPLAATSTAVPEPATGIMLMLGVAATLFRRCEVVSKRVVI